MASVGTKCGRNSRSYLPPVANVTTPDQMFDGLTDWIRNQLDRTSETAYFHKSATNASDVSMSQHRRSLPPTDDDKLFEYDRRTTPGYRQLALPLTTGYEYYRRRQREDTPTDYMQQSTRRHSENIPTTTRYSTVRRRPRQLPVLTDDNGRFLRPINGLVTSLPVNKSTSTTATTMAVKLSDLDRRYRQLEASLKQATAAYSQMPATSAAAVAAAATATSGTSRVNSQAGTSSPGPKGPIARLQSGDRRQLEYLGKQLQAMEKREAEMVTALNGIQQQLQRPPVRPQYEHDESTTDVGRSVEYNKGDIMTRSEKEADVILSCLWKFDELLNSGRYQEAIHLAVNSPEGILCNLSTLKRLRDCTAHRARDSKSSPALLFCDAIVMDNTTSTPLDDEMTSACVLVALDEERPDLIRKWLQTRHKRLTLTESIGSAIYRRNGGRTGNTKLFLQLALNIYLKTESRGPAMVCMARLGNWDQLEIYAHSDDVTQEDLISVLRECPGLRLMQVLFDLVVDEESSRHVPLGVIATTLLEAGAADVLVRVVRQVYDNRLQMINSEDNRPFHRPVFEDDVTSQDQWLDIVHVLQTQGLHDCALELLHSVTAVFAIKNRQRQRSSRSKPETADSGRDSNYSSAPKSVSHKADISRSRNPSESDVGKVATVNRYAVRSDRFPVRDDMLATDTQREIKKPTVRMHAGKQLTRIDSVINRLPADDEISDEEYD